MSKINKWHIFFLSILLVLFGYFITDPIVLINSDLGRHLKNGEVILKTFSVQEINLYSYTFPNFPFINHHWGSGVIFYLIQHFTGFVGLSIFFLILNLVTFIVFFLVAWRFGSFTAAFLASIAVIPLFMTRTEIRPEIFSYLFCGVFLWILLNAKPLFTSGGAIGRDPNNAQRSEHWREEKLRQNLTNLLWLLPILELVWVNLHIYFFLGPFIIALFLIETKNKRVLFFVFILTCFMTLFNPAGLTGALYPFNIFKNYGFNLQENQSILTLTEATSFEPTIYFLLAFFMLFLSWIVRIILVKKRRATFSPVEFILSAIVTISAWIAVRNLALFAYFVVFQFALNLKGIKKFQSFTSILILSVVLVFFIFALKPFYFTRHRFGLGLQVGTDTAAKFITDNQIKGPIFNNYDIGGFLLYYLYPREKVFIDNRPEAYPASFLQKVYLQSMQGSRWDELDKTYHFNAIIYLRSEMTAWRNNFTLLRFFDPNWSAVYLDRNIIILLKRNEINKKIIDKFEIKNLIQYGS